MLSLSRAGGGGAPAGRSGGWRVEGGQTEMGPHGQGLVADSRLWSQTSSSSKARWTPASPPEPAVQPSGRSLTQSSVPAVRVAEGPSSVCKRSTRPSASPDRSSESTGACAAMGTCPVRPLGPRRRPAGRTGAGSEPAAEARAPTWPALPPILRRALFTVRPGGGGRRGTMAALWSPAAACVRACGWRCRRGAPEPVQTGAAWPGHRKTGTARTQAPSAVQSRGPVTGQGRRRKQQEPGREAKGRPGTAAGSVQSGRDRPTRPAPVGAPG